VPVHLASAQCEDPDIQAIIEAGTASMEWVCAEFVGADLSDKRLERRLIKTAEQLASSPASPINEACGDWASTQAAYRLFDNGKASPGAILAPHIQATVKRMLAVGGPVLAIQDTVFFSYGHHPKTKGIGPIGNSNSEHERGLIMHNALAFTPAGVPLGLLSQKIWSRREAPDEGYQETIERLQCTPIEEKESSKWLQALRETVELAPRGVQLITVADRESDFFEFLTQATEQRARFLIRARTDRLLVPEESEGFESILDAYASAKVLGSLTVHVPGNGKRKARTAQVQVRVAPVTIKAPRRRGAAKASGSTEPIRVQVIAATESAPLEGQEAISWVLLTNLPVPDFESAVEKVQWYARRWGIETWHKVLKSGCKVEKCLLETADRLTRYLTLFSIIGVRLMHVAYLARAQPDLPAAEVFSPAELEALHVRVHRTLPPAKGPSLREAVRMVGSLGGHLGRKCDGEPGMTVIWRGWISLYETVLALRAAREAGLIDSS
jgi:transposase-like protein/transposase Tn5 family protein